MNIRKILREAKLTIMVTFIAATIPSICLCLIPFIVEIKGGEGKVIAYAIAAIFWISVLLTFVAAQSTKKTLYRLRKKLIIQGYINTQQPIGIVSFSKDWRMWILYGTTILGLVLIATDIIFRYVHETIMFPIISVTILSFAVHCVVDGKYYKTYKLIKESVNNETNR